MGHAVVLLHGSANGSFCWGPLRRLLGDGGPRVVALDMLGYGASPPSPPHVTLPDELAHLHAALERARVTSIHLVTHSLGTFFGLHLRRVLGARVTRLTLVDPLVVGLLPDEVARDLRAAYAAFMAAATRDPAAAARGFVEYWNGADAWQGLGERAQQVITQLVPRLSFELTCAGEDPTTLAELAAAPVPPTTILVGEHTLAAPRATAWALAPAFAAELVSVPGAAHMIPLTHPQAIAAALAPHAAEDSR